MLNSMYYSKTDLLRPPPLIASENWLNERLHKRNTRIVPVWKDQNLILDHKKPTAVIISGNHARGLLEISTEIAFLSCSTLHRCIKISNAHFLLVWPRLGPHNSKRKHLERVPCAVWVYGFVTLLQRVVDHCRIEIDPVFHCPYGRYFNMVIYI